MKKIILFLLFLLPLTLKAQENSDTVRITKSISFDREVINYVNGHQTEKVYAIYNNKYYESNKTSMKRYELIRRFEGIPTVVLITTGKTKRQKIIVL